LGTQQVASFYHYSREQCLNICGHVPGIGFYSHHVTSNTPLRLANSAVISCWYVGLARRRAFT
jgi:hypothetical protein